MRPFSRGTVTLQSSSPFTPALIDPRYGSNPLDIQILQAALAFNTRLLSTPSMKELEPIQIFPPPDATDEEVVQYIDVKWQTEYHPAGTCAMMPLELGGVVSSELVVYGTRNLRVVDSSVMPMLPASHLQAVVYGVAEKVCFALRWSLMFDIHIADVLVSGCGYHKGGSGIYQRCWHGSSIDVERCGNLVCKWND